MGAVVLSAAYGVIGIASGFADRAVDAYRSRLQAQLAHRRLDALQFNLLISAGVASVGMVVEALAMQVRVGLLQRAVEEAAAGGDLVTAERLRGELVRLLQEPPASARLMQTLAEYIPAVVAAHRDDHHPVIEGEVL